jgi:hypothetical protein
MGEVLSAQEAADRVAARWRSNRTEFDYFKDETVYTCENCGGHNFDVIHEYVQVTTAQRTLECSCDDGVADEPAAVETTVCRESVRERGPLDDDHRFQIDEAETDDREWDDSEWEVNCQACLDAAEQIDWEEDDHPEVECEDDEFAVRCASCDHEVEFGWSHPDRGGRVWPCEANDHNPWKSWPEPRFAEAWAKRGWLRPNRPEVAR